MTSKADCDSKNWSRNHNSRLFLSDGLDLYMQWRNSRGRVPPPRHFSPENFCWSSDLPGKEREGKKEKWRRKEGKWKKGRWKNIENGRRKSYKMRRGLYGGFWFFFFVLFLFFVLFCYIFRLSLFKTRESFGSTKIGIFYREKAFHTGKKIRKKDCPLWFFSLTNLFTWRWLQWLHAVYELIFCITTVEQNLMTI